MSLLKTARYTRQTFGDNGVYGKKNIVSASFASMDLGKPAAASATAVLAATTVTSVKEIQTVVVDATGGTFTLTFEGQTTGAIAYNADTATVQAALVALSNVGTNDVVVSGTASNYTVTFTGVLVGNRTQMTSNAASLTGGAGTVTHATTQQGTVSHSVTLSTNFSVPRALVVTPSATTADVAAGDVTVYGTNVEGKSISETFTFAENASTATNGAKAFKTVTSVTFYPQDGTGAKFAIGTLDIFGVGIRVPSGGSYEVLVNAAGTETIEAAGASAYSTTAIESNTVTLTTATDAAKNFVVYTFWHNWHLNPTNSNPSYGA